MRMGKAGGYHTLTGKELHVTNMGMSLDLLIQQIHQQLCANWEMAAQSIHHKLMTLMVLTQFIRTVRGADKNE